MTEVEAPGLQQAKNSMGMADKLEKVAVGQEKQLRIIHLVSSLAVGGMEHFVLRIAAAQRKQGHQSFIIALKDGPLREEAQKLGLSHFVVGGKLKHLRVAKATLLMASLRPHILHAHNQSSLHYATFGKRVSGAKVVMTNHGQGAGSARLPGNREWDATDAVIAVSNAVAERMDKQRLGCRLKTIYNGVDITPARQSRWEVREKLQIADERIVGAMVARMDGMKGHDTLLEAIACLQKENAPVTILIAGDGKERANMERLAQQLNLTSETVRFLGFRTDVADLLNASDFFTLPSLSEGLPLSVLEAMSHALPTVATSVGGIPELTIDGQHGFLVPVKDSLALAEAISRLVHHSQLRRALGQAAFERVRDNFSFEQMTRQYETLYYALRAS